MSHILGYSREISSKQIKTMGDYYSPGDIVGYAGIEKHMKTFYEVPKEFNLLR